MSQCRTCPHRLACRVPGDLTRFNAVATRLEEQKRAPLLRERLHYYADHHGCLVDAGFVDL